MNTACLLGSISAGRHWNAAILSSAGKSIRRDTESDGPHYPLDCTESAGAFLVTAVSK